MVRFNKIMVALLSLVMSGLYFSEPAQADIYAYIDEQGVSHFSNYQLDEHYTLFMREPQMSKKPVANKASSKNGRALVAKRQEYEPLVVKVAQENGLSPALLHAVITAESGYNPSAVSIKGAMGMMQLMPDTAKRYGVSNPHDPEQNIRGGARYLRDLIALFNNNLNLAVAAYNAGENAVIRHGNAIPAYRETRAYVPMVMGVYENLKNLY